MQGFFRTPQSEWLRHGLDLCSSSPSTGSSLGCQLQCSLPGHCCHWVLLLSSWCNQKADHLASSKRPPGAYLCLLVGALWLSKVTLVVVAALHGVEPAHSVTPHTAVRIAGAVIKVLDEHVALSTSFSSITPPVVRITAEG